MNDIEIYIDNKEEFKSIIHQIGTEFPEGHRIRKMVEKIISRYRNELDIMTFKADGEVNIDQLQLWQIPFPLSHEARCMNEKYSYLAYHLMSFHKMKKTPASVKSLIEILLKSAREVAQEIYAKITELYGKIEVERDPLTGKVRKKLPDDGFTKFGALINIKSEVIHG